MKTPEELAVEYADGLVFDEGMFNTAERAFLAGYQAAKDQQEQRRLINKKRRKKLKRSNRQAKTLLEVLDEAIKDIKEVKDE
jgi:hypothetical protein